MKTQQKLGLEPAFPPSREMQELAPTCYGYHVGMSKRFYAACAAMHGLCASPDKGIYSSIEQAWEHLAKTAFIIADQLLKQETE